MATNHLQVGVLALQGAFESHIKTFETMGIEAIPVRSTQDLERVHKIVIPGGESTTMTKLLNKSGLYESIVEFAAKNPILGTCAGLIMMADNAMDDRVNTLKLLDIDVERNASGRQIHSLVDSVCRLLTIQ